MIPERSHGIIYLATPYSDPDPRVRRLRYVVACRIAGDLIQRGHHIYSPISHGYGIERASTMQGDVEAWRRHNRAFFDVATQLWVAQMPGWDTSAGVREEEEMANGRMMPVVYIDPQEAFAPWRS